MYERYSWDEPRIHVNLTHHYWRGNPIGGREQRKRTIRLLRSFLENCLWTPKLSFLGAVEDSIATSTAKMEPYLGFRHGHPPMIVLSSLQMKITINCNMRFDNFPFDAQVG